MSYKTSIEILEEVRRYAKSKSDTDTLIRTFNRVNNDIHNMADFSFMRFLDNLTSGTLHELEVTAFATMINKAVGVTVDGVETILREGTEWTASISNKKTARSICDAIQKEVSNVLCKDVGAFVEVRRGDECRILSLDTNAVKNLDATIKILTFGTLGGDTVTVKVDSVTTVLTEGVDWTAAVDNNTTAASLQAAIDAVSGLTATVITDTVTIFATNPDNELESIVTSAGSGELTLTTTTIGSAKLSTKDQRKFLLSNINDQDGTNNLVKKVFAVQLKDTPTVDTASQDAQFGFTINLTNLIVPGQQISGWNVKGDILTFDIAPGDGTLEIQTLHFPLMLTRENIKTHVPEIPIAHRDVIASGMKVTADIESFGDSPIAPLFADQKRQLLADYRGRNQDDDNAHEINQFNLTDQGARLPKF